MKKLETFLAGLIIGGMICMIAYALTSCSSTRTNYWTSTKVCDQVRNNFVGYK